MTRPDPARPPHDLFDAIATLLEPGQREYFYQRMLYFRQLRPDDELLRIVEAIGFLALIIRDAPHAVAIEREHLEQLLATHRASVEATAKAARAHQEQLDDRLTRLPADIAAGISPPAIAQAICESLRSCLHGHSALSCASSRHSGGKELLTGSDRDPGYGSAHLLVRRAVPVLPASPPDARARVPWVGTAVSTAWSRGRVD